MARWKLTINVKTDSPAAKLPGISQGYGYGDEGVLSDERGDEVWRGPMRVWPNPFDPDTHEPWYVSYGCVAPGSYPFAYYVSKKNGPSLMLNKAKAVPTRYPNPTHNGRLFAKAVAVHAGGQGKNRDWPGSRACITVCPTHKDAFFSFFRAGDTGSITIVDLLAVPKATPQATAPDRQVATRAFAKPVYASKTIWVNLVACAAGALLNYSDIMPLQPGILMLIVAALNIGLRLVTKRPLIPDREFESWVIDLMLDSYDIDIDGMLKARKRRRRRAAK
jgi:hypothetical protein